MRISAVAFTAAGEKLAKQLTDVLRGRGHEISGVLCGHSGEKRESLSDWTRASFAHDEGIIFVGACGIAVRSIAPFLRDKRSDPAVVVIDERGRFAISLLSGHIGGANFLAEISAEILGATAVITTATDVNGRFAVDMWAQRQGILLGDAGIARDISAAILAGDFVGICSDFSLIGTPPCGVTPMDGAFGSCGDPSEDGAPRGSAPATVGGLGICVSYDGEKRPFARTLSAIPRRLILGIGCRRGVTAEAIGSAVDRALSDRQISLSAVAQVASIDLKTDEPGLLEFCEKHSLPLRFFAARELAELEGKFTASEFVSGVTGVDNVCERAAVAALESGGGLIIKKQARDGVTVAVAEPDFDLTFEF